MISLHPIMHNCLLQRNILSAIRMFTPRSRKLISKISYVLNWSDKCSTFQMHRYLTCLLFQIHVWNLKVRNLVVISIYTSSSTVITWIISHYCSRDSIHYWLEVTVTSMPGCSGIPHGGSLSGCILLSSGSDPNVPKFSLQNPALLLALNWLVSTHGVQILLQRVLNRFSIHSSLLPWLFWISVVYLQHVAIEITSW